MKRSQLSQRHQLLRKSAHLSSLHINNQRRSQRGTHQSHQLIIKTTIFIQMIKNPRDKARRGTLKNWIR
jgi:hypothetical protein